MEHLLGEKTMREKLSDLEHEQWMKWSKELAGVLEDLRDCVVQRRPGKAVQIINNKIRRWEEKWKPYCELSEFDKDLDREWADKVIKIIEEEKQ